MAEPRKLSAITMPQPMVNSGGTTYFVLFLLYIIAPKIDIFTINKAGVRPEDFLTLIAAILYATQRHKNVTIIPKYLKYYLYFIIFCFISSLLNYNTNGIIGFVYTARLIEYVVWFFIGYETASSVSRRTCREGLLIVTAILSIWGVSEYFNLIPKIGRFVGAEGRLSINTSGPFETSVVRAALAFAAQQWIATPVLAALVWFTQARITLVAGAISLIARRPGRGLLITLLSAVLVIVASGPLATVLENSRFSEAQSGEQMIATLERSWKKAPILAPDSFAARFLVGGEIGRYIELGARGTSFNIRAIRLTTVIKSTIVDYWHLMIGWSPGAWGLALDGHYVRVFAETGLIGTALFLAWIVTMLRELTRGSIAAFIFAMLCIIAVFIDIFSSSKAMPMLWFFAALDAAGHPHRFPSTSSRRTARQKYALAEPV